MSVSPGRLLVFGTADWNQAIRTNQHYMVQELAQATPLTFIESIGFRSPRLSRRDLAKVTRRLRPNSLRTTRQVPEGVDIVTPRVLPRHRGLASIVNRPLLHHLVKDWIVSADPRILWSYSPITYGLESLAARTAYHCVDLLGAVDGVDPIAIDRGERRLAESGAIAIGTSGPVIEHLTSQGFENIVTWPNVADTITVEAAQEKAAPRVPGRVVFAGNLTTMKVDFALLSALVDGGVEVHLAGPIAPGDGAARAQVDSLVMRGATYHGHLELPDLAALYWSSSVGIIPYLINNYTLGVDPLKTFEYLAAGLTVVSTALPAVIPKRGDVYVAKEPRDFIQAVISSSMENHSPASQCRRQARARDNSWIARGQAARELLAELRRDPGA